MSASWILRSALHIAKISRMQFKLEITCNEVAELHQLLDALKHIGIPQTTIIPRPAAILPLTFDPFKKEKKEGKPKTVKAVLETTRAKVKKERKPREVKEKATIRQGTCVVCFKEFDTTTLNQKTCGLACDKALWYRKSVIRKMDFNLKPEIVDAMALSHFVKKRSEGKIKDQRARRVTPPSELPIDLPIETNTVSDKIPNKPFEMVMVGGKEIQYFGTPEQLVSFKRRIAEKEEREKNTFKNNPGMKKAKAIVETE